MKKFKIFICLNLIFLILSSCGTIKKGFKNPKKNSSDEFLVEKKSPLVMPPEFNELPVPNDKNDDMQKKESNLKELISENENDQDNATSNNDLEGSILDKIKTD